MDRTERVRRRLQHRLGAAYADGLISHDTFARRVDELLAMRLIDSHRLVGDLSERSNRRGVLATVRESLRTRFWPPSDDEVLALDWTGTASELVIGRSRSCDVVVDHPEVSRRHARLVFRDGSWFVQDLESMNGTTVNGTRVGRCRLLAGDRLVVGGYPLKID